MKINGHAWMRALRMPPFTIARLREMRVDEQLVMLNIQGPASFPTAEPAVATIVFDRDRGGIWHYDALWMLHVGKSANRRGHIWTFGNFKLVRGGDIEFVADSISDTPEKVAAAERQLRRISRLAARLAMMAQARGDRAAYVGLYPYPKSYRQNGVPESTAATFLASLAGPPVTLAAPAA